MTSLEASSAIGECSAIWRPSPSQTARDPAARYVVHQADAQASSASTVRAVKISSFAIARPYDRGQPAGPHYEPVVAPTKRKLRVSEAIRMSQPREDGAAAVAVAVDRRDQRLLHIAPAGSPPARPSLGRSPAVLAVLECACAMSAPAQNAFSPAPVRTMTRTSSSASSSSRHSISSADISRDGVVLLRPVQPDDIGGDLALEDDGFVVVIQCCRGVS